MLDVLSVARSTRAPGTITVSLLQGRAGAVADPYSVVNYLIARCQQSAPVTPSQQKQTVLT